MKIEHYRTEKVNSVIELTSQLSNDSGEIKKPDFSNFEEKSGDVPYGLDLSNFLDDFQVLRMLMNAFPRIP